VDFPQVVGRYVILKWHPASKQGGAFSIAQVAAFGVSKHAGGVLGVDGKEMADGKDALYGDSGKEGKEFEQTDIPGEGPPPALPPVPPFTFIPEVAPTSP
jgi:hypothetical protein